MKVDDITDADIADAMVQYGGSFCRGLGALWFKADEHNRARLQLAFGNYFIEYKELVALKRKGQPT